MRNEINIIFLYLLYDAFIYACHVNSGVLFLHMNEVIYLLPYYRGGESGSNGVLCGDTTENPDYCRLSPITFITATLGTSFIPNRF